MSLRRSCWEVPLPPKVTLAKRLEPLLDSRVVLTLATTLVALSGIFTVYTYFAVVFDRAIGGNAVVLGSLLVIWGIGGTVSNLFGGRVVDIVGSRRVIVTILVMLAVFSAVLPWLGSESSPPLSVYGEHAVGVSWFRNNSGWLLWPQRSRRS